MMAIWICPGGYLLFIRHSGQIPVLAVFTLNSCLHDLFDTLFTKITSHQKSKRLFYIVLITPHQTNI